MVKHMTESNSAHIPLAPHAALQKDPWQPALQSLFPPPPPPAMRTQHVENNVALGASVVQVRHHLWQLVCLKIGGPRPRIEVAQTKVDCICAVLNRRHQLRPAACGREHLWAGGRQRERRGTGGQVGAGAAACAGAGSTWGGQRVEIWVLALLQRGVARLLLLLLLGAALAVGRWRSYPASTAPAASLLFTTAISGASSRLGCRAASPCGCAASGRA